MRGDAPTPVVGLVVAGALLILLEGAFEVAAFDAVVQVGLPVPSAFAVVPALTIFLGIVLLFAAWSYTAVPSWGVGVLFLILGGLSFLLGGGFLVGGVLILIGGGLACFAESAEATADQGVRALSAASAPRTVAGPTPRARRGAQVPSAVPWQANGPTSIGGVVVYRPCPSCGELNARELSNCSACGRAMG